ncbi:aa3-type cytochrome c oxidase subunit IV [Tateyamaria armeniaca]|uniref:Aa3-type cytochrome c oxidase subunit IV n=1 Tax=Tateyamaria armeniaca TaxID=2518930 RepID=A0ABW8UT32_9RHOB
MADHKHGDMDIKANEKTFDGFMKWTTWSVIVILVIIVGMAIFIT